MHFQLIDYGFEWGAANVTRLCSDEKRGWVLLSVKTKRHKYSHGIQIYVTKTGKVRILDQNGEWIYSDGHKKDIKRT